MILDLHIHSIYSKDALLCFSSIIKIAKARSIDAIAITDHNTIQGGIKTRELNKSELIVIIGAEIKTESGDIIGLFLTKEIKSRNSIDVINEIKDQGGIVVLPHPIRKHRLTDKLLSSIDVVEIVNGRISSRENDQALELAVKYGLPGIGGSDAHFPFEIGKVSNIIEGTKNEEGVKKAILSGKSKVIRKNSYPFFCRILSTGVKRVRLISGTKSFDVEFHKNIINNTLGEKKIKF